MEIIEQAENFVVETVSNLPRPKATLTGVDLTGVGLDGVTLLAKVSVSNPYMVPIPIGEIVYTVKSAGNVIASGSVPDPGSLTANGSTTMDVTVKVPYSAVVSLVVDISGDWDVDYVLDLGMIIDLPVIGNITIPMSHSSVMKLPTFADFFMGKAAEPSQELVK